MKKSIIFLTFLLFACNNAKEVVIQNIEETQTLILVDKTMYPNHVKLQINGRVEGQVDITVSATLNTLNAEVHDTLMGDIDTLIRGGDWYKDTIFVQLKPLTATKGQLKFNYSIWSF